LRFGFCDYFPGHASLPHISQMYGDVCRWYPIDHRSQWFGDNSLDLADKTVAALAAKGIGSLIHIAYGDKTVDQFKAEVRFWADRYKATPSMSGFELGNEPNMARFNPVNGHRAFTPAEAAHYVREGYGQAKAAGWAKPLITAGPARIGGREAWQTYLKRMFEAGLPDELDLAGHPYPEQGKDFRQSVEYQIDTWRKILRNKSGHGRYWATETGFGTGGAGALSQEEQARHLIEVVKLCAEKNIQAVTIFRYADSPNPNPKYPYDWYGVTGQAYSPKQAWHALRAFV
jgi:hypothetical protein